MAVDASACGCVRATGFTFVVTRREAEMLQLGRPYAMNFDVLSDDDAREYAEDKRQEAEAMAELRKTAPTATFFRNP